MDKITDIMFSNIAICCYEAVILVFVFIRFIRLRKEKKKAVEMSTLQKDRAREEKLDQVLKNRLYRGENDKVCQNNIPYEVSFHEETGLRGESDDSVAIQIIEKGKLATRKYVMFISEVVTIGQSSNNILIINDLKIAKEQCRIFQYNKALYIQTLEDTHPVTIRRGRKRTQLTKDALMILNGDVVELGETTLTIYLL